MNSEVFESFARFVERRVSRRGVLSGVVAGAAALTPFKGKRAAAQTLDPSALVQSFYACVNAFRYDEAYALLGSKWRSQQSLAAFTNGYANTAFVQCEAASTKQAAGDTHLVRVRLISWHNDGAIVGYEGAYTVGDEAGELRMLAGDNTRVAPPAGTPPLCGIPDLTLAFGPWDGAAGSREGSIVGTNVSAARCVVGGSPRVTLTDASQHVLRSTSQVGSPPTGIVLEPGAAAHAPLRFSDWCGATDGPVTIAVELPGDQRSGSVDASEFGVSYPPCLGPDQPAVLEIKAWLAGAA